MIDLDQLDSDRLPEELAVSALTMASWPPGRTPPTIRRSEPDVRTGLQRSEVLADPLPFDAEAARACGLVFTRNGDDFRFIGGLVDVIEV